MKPLEKAQQRMQEMREAGEIVQKTKWQKWKENNTRKSSIDAFCEQCMGGPDDPGYRQQIRGCTSGPGAKVECPLWQWRPYR